jgi:hypothetical protein
MSLFGRVSRAVTRFKDSIAITVSNIGNAIDPSRKLEEIALPLAESWKSDHPNAQPGSDNDFNDCVIAVAAGCAVAGTAIGGVVGATLGTGGGVAAA